MSRRYPASVAEHAIPGDAVRSHDLPLGLLIAARNAARVALGGLHLGPALLKPTPVRSRRGALPRSAWSFAVLRHHSSRLVEAAFPSAYHVTTQ